MTDNDAVADRMVFLGFGKWARADRIYALEPITGDERGGGRRTRVWIDGVAEPILAGRTERTILHDMGQDAATTSLVLDDALDLAERVAKAVEEGPLDLRDLGRRARRVLEKTAKPAEPEQLF
jgi:sirohydrochlorin ferrochelatase